MARVEEECDRFKYLSAPEAKALGIVDDIIGGDPPRFYPELGRLGLIRGRFAKHAELEAPT